MSKPHRVSRLLTLLLLVALALPLSAPFAHADGDEETLRQLEDTVIPARDRVDLAERLLGVTDIPEPPTSAPELQVGDVLTFSADNLDQDYQFEIDARLVYATEHIYMFFEEGYDPNLAAVQRSADTFEETIRPKVIEVFGSEWFPGIDGDPHLYILHARNLGSWVAAYYGSESEYPTEAVAGSNEHEMFFVNLDTMEWAIGTPYYEGVLAHEFQHMVHWNVDANEDTWLNEGLSELAAMIAGYGASDFTPDFLQSPNLQLNTWPEDDDRGLHYGAAFAFLAYFYERYGEEATTTLVSDAKNGLESVDETLAAIGATDPTTGEPVTLVALFGDWLATNLIQDASVGDGRYAYTFSEMMDLPKASITETLALSDVWFEASAPQWGPDYLALPNNGTETFHFAFDGSETASLVPADAHSGEMMWWSNRADESDSRLTRAFDLTNVDSATLNYWTWYWIEEGWDFGYVMVSTDDGATWTPLETPLTTTDDPHGNSYGPGYTGQSGDWVQESLDLTSYAGQPILVRFEYITDDAVTQPGLIIDDVSVPELDYSEDFESGDGGWTSEGWILMNNRLPQTFLVEVVAPGSDTPVTRLLGPEDGTQGEWDIPLAPDGQTVIVIAGLAPVTTEPADYSYTLTAVE
ncbi:choice-of-anchor J domain-containing protein [Aggregatilinea lenta]|uniref:choice-of-anchor J domain-containing protein n=1 Tax=Aggregatilinea lenta TaxID=913108 RepID=UPI000E5A6A77|nr:choice-of-anchor J domain-containing protein [Aggregatilinea lenta]